MPHNDLVKIRTVAEIPSMQLLCSCHIAGAQPAGATDAVRALKVGQVLELQRDANNSYDPYAVLVMLPAEGDGFPRKLGFIPGASANGENIPISALIDSGLTPTVIVQELDQADPPRHVRFYVTLGVYVPKQESNNAAAG